MYSLEPLMTKKIKTRMRIEKFNFQFIYSEPEWLTTFTENKKFTDISIKKKFKKKLGIECNVLHKQIDNKR